MVDMCYSSVMVNEATRMRVIRAILGVDMQTFARHFDVSPNTVRNWERGISIPNTINRKTLSGLLLKNRIAIRPDGFPVPSE